MRLDRPASTKEEDELNRWNLAEGVARELATGHDFGLTMGVYGPWGSGKTSFLKFVEAHLKLKTKKDIIWANSWLGHSWEVYAQILFQRIFERLDKDFVSKKQKAANSFKTLLEAVPGKFKVGLPFDIASAEVDVAGVGRFLSQVAQIDLVKVRDYLRAQDDPEPVIVFIDDVDRQEASEIKELFRLLRFFSEIPNLNFLIAIDPFVVKPALEAVYSTDGLRVLEKFIQAPIKLPTPKSEMIIGILSNTIDSVLAGQELEKWEQKHLEKGIYPLLLQVLKTPRQIHVIGNTLTVALGLLGSEVNKADLIFINVLNTTHPELVKAIFDHRDLLLGTTLAVLHFTLGDDNEALQAILRTFDRNWGDLSGEKALEILKLLFPQIKSLFYTPNRSSSYSRGEVGPRRHKRICHEDFFHRYFELNISDKELKESDIDSFIEMFQKSKFEEILTEFQRLLNLDPYLLIMGLESRLERDGIWRESSALLIALHANSLCENNRKPHLFPGILSSWSAAGRLVPKLYFADQELSEKNLCNLVDASKPTTFALEWAHSAREGFNDDKLFWNWFKAAIVQKIAEENSQSTTVIFQRHSLGMTIVLMDLWLQGSDQSTVQKHMAEHLQKKPSLLIDFLVLYVTQGKIIVGDREKEADDLDHDEFIRLSQFLDYRTIETCFTWLNGNPDFLKEMRKYKQTALYQFCDHLTKDFAWSKHSNLFHQSSCPRVGKIKPENLHRGLPDKLKPHKCAEGKEKLLEELKKLTNALSKVKDIGKQDF